MNAGTKNKVKKAASAVKEGAKSAAKKTGEFAAKNPKTLLYIGLGAGVLYLIYKLTKGVSDVTDKLSGKDIQTNINVANDLVVKANNLTITQSQAKIYASQLLTAFNWYNGFPRIEGTDTPVITSIFNKINSEDFKLIYKEFGMKLYNGFRSPPQNIGGGVQETIGIAENRDLVYWLASELSSVWDMSTYKKVKSIVEGAGFVFA